MPLGYLPWSSSAATVRPVRVFAIRLTMTSWLVSGRLRQFIEIWLTLSGRPRPGSRAAPTVVRTAGHPDYRACGGAHVLLTENPVKSLLTENPVKSLLTENPVKI